MLQIVNIFDDILIILQKFEKIVWVQKTWMKFNHVYWQNREGAGSGVGRIDDIVVHMSAHAQYKIECDGVKTFVYSPIAYIKVTCT